MTPGARFLMWVLVVLAVIAAAFGLMAAIDHFHAGLRAEGFKAGDAAGAARIQGRWDADRAAALVQANEDARRSAAETDRRLRAQQENQRAQDELLARTRRDRDAAVAAVGGLQLRAAAYLDAAGCGALSGDSALECVRKAASQIGVVLGQCAARHQQLADDADDARARGLKCEADYDALTVK